MGMKRAVLVASFTIDVIRIGDKVYEKIGGPAYYSGLTLKMLGLDPIIITSLGSGGVKKIREMLSASGAAQDLDVIDTDPQCSSIYTFYHTYTTAGRQSEIHSVGCRIKVDRVTSSIGKDSQWILVSPVFREILPEDFTKIPGENSIALDLQGYAREIKDHSVLSSLNNIRDNIKKLPRVRIVHLSSDDIKDSSTSGIDIDRDLEDLSFLAENADIIAYTIGAKGGYLGLITIDRDRESRRHIPSRVVWHYIPPYSEIDGGDPTGCGDIFLASMVGSMIMDNNPIDAAVRASIVSGMRVSRGFPIKIDLTEIETIGRSLRERVHMI